MATQRVFIGGWQDEKRFVTVEVHNAQNGELADSYAIPELGYHGPGISWGYDGMGPKGLAYDVLFELYGEVIARRFHLPFAEAFTYKLDETFQLTEQQVNRVLDDVIERTTKNTDVKYSYDPKRGDEYQERAERRRERRIQRREQLEYERRSRIAAAQAHLDWGAMVEIYGKAEPMTLKEVAAYYGDDLAPILERYGDWVVTAEGVDCLYVRYPIDTAMLNNAETNTWSWLEQLANKKWLRNPLDLARALEAARRWHVYTPSNNRSSKSLGAWHYS